jgi:uncharacterized protein DUF5677
MNASLRDNERERGSRDEASLLQAARSCIRAWHHLPFPYRVADRRHTTFRAGFALAAHALNNVEVALNIWDQLPWVAAANGRVAFEHAFVAQWLFVAPEGPGRFARHVTHSNLVQAQELDALIENEPELAAVVSAEDLAAFHNFASQAPAPGGERSWSLPNLFSRFDASGLLYGSYRSLSTAVHPSANTLRAYVCDVGEDQFRIQRDGAGIADRHESAQGIALAGLWSLNFIEKCSDGYEPPGKAGEIGVAKRLPYDLADSDRLRGRPGSR